MTGPETIQTAYHRPRNLQAALEILAAQRPAILCGGTDFYPARVGRPVGGPILDLSAVDGLAGITSTPGSIRIGAATTWRTIARTGLPSALRGLQDAARQVGSIQVQNRGTIGGNLCNASPAADGVPPLLALDARVELASRDGHRILALADFITGYRKTALVPGEMVLAVHVPMPADDAVSVFSKLGARRYLVISIVMVAVTLTPAADGSIARIAVAVGSASEKAVRLGALEEALTGLDAGKRPSAQLRPDHLAALSPIDDVRATADYRRDAAFSLVADALDQAAGFVR